MGVLYISAQPAVRISLPMAAAPHAAHRGSWPPLPSRESAEVPSRPALTPRLPVATTRMRRPPMAPRPAVLTRLSHQVTREFFFEPLAVSIGGRKYAGTGDGCTSSLMSNPVGVKKPVFSGEDPDRDLPPARRFRLVAKARHRASAPERDRAEADEILVRPLKRLPVRRTNRKPQADAVRHEVLL